MIWPITTKNLGHAIYCISEVVYIQFFLISSPNERLSLKTNFDTKSCWASQGTSNMFWNLAKQVINYDKLCIKLQLSLTNSNAPPIKLWIVIEWWHDMDIVHWTKHTDKKIVTLQIFNQAFILEYIFHSKIHLSFKKKSSEIRITNSELWTPNKTSIQQLWPSVTLARRPSPQATFSEWREKTKCRVGKDKTLR